MEIMMIRNSLANLQQRMPKHTASSQHALKEAVHSRRLSIGIYVLGIIVISVITPFILS
jgi:t-SNARE complex subunit (syntaxin)